MLVMFIISFIPLMCYNHYEAIKGRAGRCRYFLIASFGYGGQARRAFLFLVRITYIT